MFRCDRISVFGEGEVPVVYKAVPFTKVGEPIGEFQPKPGHGVHAGEKLVWAAFKKGEAAVFLVEHDESWVFVGGVFGSVVCVFIGDEKRWRANDQGGSIYTLPARTFKPETKVWPGRAVVSRKLVKPFADCTEEYSSGLGAMMKHGVQVYFVNKRTLKEVDDYCHQASERIKEVLQRLCKLKSENQKLGVNAVNFKGA